MTTPRLPDNRERSGARYIRKREQMERRAAAMRERNAWVIEARERSIDQWLDYSPKKRRRITERARLVKAARSTGRAHDTAEGSVAA